MTAKAADAARWRLRARAPAADRADRGGGRPSPGDGARRAVPRLRGHDPQGSPRPGGRAPRHPHPRRRHRPRRRPPGARLRHPRAPPARAEVPDGGGRGGARHRRREHRARRQHLGALHRPPPQGARRLARAHGRDQQHPDRLRAGGPPGHHRPDAGRPGPLGGPVRRRAPWATASSAGSTCRRHSWARPGSRSRPASRTRWRRRPRSSGRWWPRRGRSSPSSTTRSGSRIASATFCRTDRLTGVFTDDEAPPSMVAALREAGIDVREIGLPADAAAPAPRLPAADRAAIAAGRPRDRREGRLVTAAVAAPDRPPRVELRGISKSFGATAALDRRLDGPPRRRDPRPRRRERRRQEHARQDPGRRPPAGQRHDPARGRADPDPRTRPVPRARDRRRPPGAAALPGPHRRRERVHRPRALGRRSAPSTGAACAGRRRRCSTSSTSSSTSAPRSGASRWRTSS